MLWLHKALYGLRQVPQVWNTKLHGSLAAHGFKKCLSKHTVYMCSGAGRRLLVGVYVDDLIVSPAPPHERSGPAELLPRDRGNQRLGCILIGQAEYAGKLLEKAGMGDCNSVAVPM